MIAARSTCLIILASNDFHAQCLVKAIIACAGERYYTLAGGLSRILDTASPHTMEGFMYIKTILSIQFPGQPTRFILTDNDMGVNKSGMVYRQGILLTR
jgi:hypothetical protein